MIQSYHHFHRSVLVHEVLEYLLTDPAGVYIDGTLGGGGHCEVLLKNLDQSGQVIGIDRDIEAIRFCQGRIVNDRGRVRMVHGRFSEVDQILKRLKIDHVDGLLLDLGVSSHQIDTSERGFSYMNEGPLDMRMDSRIEKKAFDVVNDYSEKALFNIFVQYGEERYARRLARKVVERRSCKLIQSTSELAALIRENIPIRGQIKTLSRIFQAIRIEVNDEMNQLREGFERFYPFLKNHGRIVVITYHSLEARMVKRFFRGETLTYIRGHMVQSEAPYQFRLLTRKSISPSDIEIRENSRARSARLRAAEKIYR